MTSRVPVIDLFAGPGGLGEGFASLSDFFRIEVSAECATPAHRTLRLRAFKRALEDAGLSLDCYYDYLNGYCDTPVAPYSKEAWEQAEREALQLELGQPEDDALLAAEMDRRGVDVHGNWVLIGGPPCQAYSIVGRARNRSKVDYVPEDDSRHFLYREYLKIIQHYRPAVFVMENVKGMLSSRVGGRKIFHQIMEDLTRPDTALGRADNGAGYRIHSLVGDDIVYHHGDDADGFGQDSFLVYAENFDVPQARHRVFLVGVREDIKLAPEPLEVKEEVPVSEVLSELPPLRGGVTDGPRQGLSRNDSDEYWRRIVCEEGRLLITEADAEGLEDVSEEISRQLERLAGGPPLGTGALRVPKSTRVPDSAWSALAQWLEDPQLEVWLNHQARAHMRSDLRRYLYAASFARRRKRTPVGTSDFVLPSLAPNHESWNSGKFADRFRVQCWGEAAKTITSHISKDGHYYIHPDPWQCRSLTVREAARLQTFPDNYFFEGNRTQQFHQVGNAVPPWLARQIGEIVQRLLARGGREGPLRSENRTGPQMVMPLG